MKKIVAGFVFAMSVSSLALACGGMTQIDPPSLQLDAGPSDSSVDSVVDELEGIVVLAETKHPPAKPPAGPLQGRLFAFGFDRANCPPQGDLAKSLGALKFDGHRRTPECS